MYIAKDRLHKWLIKKHSHLKLHICSAKERKKIEKRILIHKKMTPKDLDFVE